MASSENPKGGVDSARMTGIKNNPFLKKKSMDTQYVKKRRKSRGLNAIGRGRISSILAKWNQQTSNNNKNNNKKNTIIIDNQSQISKPKPKPKPKQSQIKSEVTKPIEPINQNSKQQIASNSSSFNKTSTEETQQLHKLKSKLSNDEEKNVSLKTENNSLEKQLIELKTRNSALSDRNNTLTQNANNMEDDILISNTCDNNNNNDEIILQLKQEVISLQNELCNASENVENASERESFINELKNKIVENENEINELNKQSNEQMNALMQENENKKNEISEYQCNICNMNGQIETEKQKTNHLQQMLLETNENEEMQQMKHKQEMETYTQKIERLETDKENKISELNECIAQHDETLTEYNVSMNELKQINNDLNGKNEELIITNMACTDKHNSNTMQELLIGIQELEKENKRLREENNMECKMEQVEIEENYIANNQDKEDEYIDIENENENENVLEAMKSGDEFIDIENDISFEIDDVDDVDGKEGWLERQSKFLKKWKRKYVRFEKQYLCIYDDQTCNEFQCDKIDLTTTELTYSFDKPTEFGLQNNNEINTDDMIIFRCNEESETDRWMTYITEIGEQEYEIQTDEFISVNQNQNNQNKQEEFVNINEIIEEVKEEKKEEIKARKKKKKKKKVHKLAMGLNIPMGGLFGGPPPSLLKKKKAAGQCAQNRELPQKEFEKPIIASNVRSAKTRSNVAPTLIKRDNDMEVNGFVLHDNVNQQ